MLYARARFKKDILHIYSQGEELQGMIKWPFIFGIILLLVTPVTLTYYNMKTPNYTYGLASTSEPSNLSTWECSANFSTNELILVDLLPNIFWSANETAFEHLDTGMPVMYADVNITDPKNTTSTYELDMTYQPSDTNRRLLPYNLDILATGEGINATVNVTETGVTFIAGRALLDGTYYANLTFVGGGVVDYRTDGTFAPGTFALYYGLAGEIQPYKSLLYANFATIPIGIILLVYGFKKLDRKQKRTKIIGAR